MPTNLSDFLSSSFTGSQGTQGVQGIQGTQGTAGAGTQGTQGVQGIQGTQGTQGVQGITGSQGTQGVQGIQGTQGTQGVQGIQGITGSQGTQGVQGTEGTQGTQGVQGIQGTSIQGTQGVQGIQGTQGTSGSGSSVNINNDTTNATRYIGFLTATTGVATQIGVASTLLQFNPSTGALGIGTVIDIIPYDSLNSGTLSWEGSAGQLFSITNNLSSGSIFSVNDVSGIPSIDVNADGTIQLGAYGGNIGVGITNPGAKFHAIAVGVGTQQIVGLFSGSTTADMVRINQTGTGNALVVEDSTNPDATPFVVGAAGSVGVGTNNPTQTLDINSTMRLRGGLYDFNNIVGVAGSTLISTGAGVSWTTPAFQVSSIGILTTGSNATYTAPSNLRYAIVIATGGGGGGGGSDTDGSGGGGGAGGAAGATAIRVYSSTELGATATYTIGANGTGGNNTGTNGTAGGNTTFIPVGTGTSLTANGGALGTGSGTVATNSTVAGSAGGTATGGQINIEGGDGGGAGGTDAGGIGVGGFGGSSFWGGGGANGVAGVSAGSAGLAGAGYGSGGGGSGTGDNATGAAGGNGQSGVIFVLEFTS